jgi:hypothetical protein
VAVAAHGSELEGLSRAAFQTALRGVASFMNSFEVGLGGSTWLYDAFTFNVGGDADHLVWLLARADAFNRLVKLEVAHEVERLSPYAGA